MKWVALIAIAGVALVVVGCGNARTSKTAFTAAGTAICLRDVVPAKRNARVGGSPSMAVIEAQRAALAGCACIVCTAGRGRIDQPRLIPRSLLRCADTLCGVPLCRICSSASASGQLNLLPYLESVSQSQLAPRITGPTGFIAPSTDNPPLVVLP